MKEEQLEEALGCLAQRFRLICDSEQPMDKVRVDSVVKRVNHSDLASKLNGTFCMILPSILRHTHGWE